jgi:hypothetical protein
VELQRFCIKFFAQSPVTVDEAKFIDIFHDWIRRGALPETLIDVADYRHVPRGPGVMLISHQANLSMDRGDDRLGLMYQRKAAQPGSFATRILATMEVALTACELLEQEPRLRGLKFNGGEFLFTVNDRRLAPDSGAITRLCEGLKSAARRLYGVDRVDIETTAHKPHERVRMLVRAAGIADIDRLLENLRCRPH